LVVAISTLLWPEDRIEPMGYPVTARDMTEKEKRRYRHWKRR